MMDAKEDDIALSALLAADTDEEPRPGFDTRFHARLDALRAKRQRKRWLFGVSLSGLVGGALAAAAIALAPGDVGDEPALEIAMEYDLLDDYEVVRDLPDLEALEMLAQADVPATGVRP